MHPKDMTNFILPEGEEPVYDKMLQRVYTRLNSRVFDIERRPDEIVYITDISEYNRSEGLAPER